MNFVKLTTIITNKKKKRSIMINVASIVAVRRDYIYPTENEPQEYTAIYLSNGDHIFVEETYEAVMKLIEKG